MLGVVGMRGPGRSRITEQVLFGHGDPLQRAAKRKNMFDNAQTVRTEGRHSHLQSFLQTSAIRQGA
jgi:hypothetical protein